MGGGDATDRCVTFILALQLTIPSAWFWVADSFCNFVTEACGLKLSGRSSIAATLRTGEKRIHQFWQPATVLKSQCCDGAACRLQDTAATIDPACWPAGAVGDMSISQYTRMSPSS